MKKQITLLFTIMLMVVAMVTSYSVQGSIPSPLPDQEAIEKLLSSDQKKYAGYLDDCIKIIESITKSIKLSS